MVAMKKMICLKKNNNPQKNGEKKINYLPTYQIFFRPFIAGNKSFIRPYWILANPGSYIKCFSMDYRSDNMTGERKTRHLAAHCVTHQRQLNPENAEYRKVVSGSFT